MTMGDLWRPATIKEVLGRHGFRFSKALGQNFLIDPRVCPRMAAESGAAECAGAIEVGPGLGVLTYELAQVAKKVVAIELDQRLFPVLGETLADCPNVELVQGDVLKLDLHALIQEKFGGQEVCVCANLPYYITSPVPGQRACGAVSVSVHYHSRPQVLFGVSRGSFLPPPNVDSAVIRLDLRREPPVQVADEGWFFRVSRAAFAQRRKTAANSISASLGLPKAQVEAALGAAGIPANARAEQLSLEQFAALANALPPLAKPGEDRV